MKFVIISGFAWIIGNVIWNKFGLYEPKIFYIPLAVFILSLCIELEKRVKTKISSVFMMYFIWLAFGNLIKQVFYSPKVSIINDYYFGGAMTLILIVRLWATRKQVSSMQ